MRAKARGEVNDEKKRKGRKRKVKRWRNAEERV